MTRGFPISDAMGRRSTLRTSWELYDMKTDRTELNDLTGVQPEILNLMIGMYEDWADKSGALLWPVVPESPASPRAGTAHIHDVR
jgi:hypothetical protein